MQPIATGNKATIGPGGFNGAKTALPPACSAGMEVAPPVVMLSRRSILGATAGAGAGAMLGAGAMPVSAAAAVEGVVPNLPRDQTRQLQRAINRAAAGAGMLHLPAGIYIAHGLEIPGPLALSGVPGKTWIVLGRPDDNLVSARGIHDISLNGIGFDGASHFLARSGYPGLLHFSRCSRLHIDNCMVKNSTDNGISLDGCSGRVSQSTLSDCLTGAIFSINARGFEVTGNHIHDIGDNGILVWQSEKREDGSIISGNRIERIFAKSGGDGPNGNGVIIFRAGSVTVANNRITDCEFSAIRDNSGDNAVITGNNCARLNEVAIFVEFAFSGAVVSNNLIEKAGMGISITNFNDGGRLAVCANNIVRDMLGARSNPDTRAIGIAVEADASVTGNIVENAAHGGLWLGWGPYLRNISATGNIVRNCKTAITLSMYDGAGNGLVANNIISGARSAIVGMDHENPVTGDLARPGAKIPVQFIITGNQVAAA